jgi:hypothetical protein
MPLPDRVRDRPANAALAPVGERAKNQIPRGLMNKLCIFGTSAILGYVGWFLGDPLGFGRAFAVSCLGALLGVYLGWKIARRFG